MPCATYGIFHAGKPVGGGGVITHVQLGSCKRRSRYRPISLGRARIAFSLPD